MWPRPMSASAPMPRRMGLSDLPDRERDPKEIAIEPRVQACEVEMRRPSGVLEGHAGVGVVDDRRIHIAVVWISAPAPGQGARLDQLPRAPGDQVLRKRIEDSADAPAVGDADLAGADKHVASEIRVVGQAATQAPELLRTEESARGRARADVRVRRDDVESLSVPETPTRRSGDIAGSHETRTALSDRPWLYHREEHAVEPSIRTADDVAGLEVAVRGRR